MFSISSVLVTSLCLESALEDISSEFRQCFVTSPITDNTITTLVDSFEKPEGRFKQLAHYANGPTKGKNCLKRSLKVTITKVRRREVVSTRLETLDVRCPSCGCNVARLSQAEALNVTGIEEEVLCDMAASGDVHMIQIDAANDRIC